MYHIYLVILLFIIIYGYIIKEKLGIDFLEKKFGKCEGCDLWAITHLSAYTILAYNFPNNTVLLFTIGVLYEFFEYYIGVSENMLKYLGPIGTDGKQSWWYGRTTDIFFNTIGILLGSAISPYHK